MRRSRCFFIRSLAAVVLIQLGCSSARGPVFREVSAIPEAQGVVYVYRPDDEQSTEFDLAYNGKEVCILGKTAYIPIFVNPGKVGITSSVRFKLFSTGLLDKAVAGTSDFFLEAEPGRTYFVECLADQAAGQKLSMALVPEDYGRLRIRECYLLPQTNDD